VSARVLVAGVGNLIRRDDGFGIEVARRLAERSDPSTGFGPGLPPSVRIVETGIGGIGLVQELMDRYDAVLVLDAVRRGGAPGTLYLLGTDNGINTQPRVQMFLSDGSREGYLAGDFARYNASDWPVPGTHWTSLWLSPTVSGSGSSLNDGSLVSATPAATTTQSYAAIPTFPTNSDQPNTAIVGPDGINQAATAFFQGISQILGGQDAAQGLPGVQQKLQTLLA